MDNDLDARVVLCTCPDEATGTRIATALIEGRHAACVNRVPGVRSMYRWDGRIYDDAEVLLVIKTTAGRLAAVEAQVRALHPYELPELLALPVAGGSVAYLEWIGQAVTE
jgi:periplasmic divalent cation tolerance protein